MPFRAALFDFDGTLADSFTAITSSTNHVRVHYGLHPLPEAKVRAYVGFGLAKLMADLVPGAPVDEAVAIYREHHEHVMIPETKLMPDVAETIPELARRGLLLGVCSNKRVEFTRELVRALGLSDYFTCVLGPDDVGQRPKPDPAMLHEGLKRLGITATDALYVGDMIIDVQTARAAGVSVCLVLPEGNTIVASAEETADHTISSFAHLLNLLPNTKN